jgi:hypothetical protein
MAVKPNGSTAKMTLKTSSLDRLPEVELLKWLIRGILRRLV